MAAARAIAPSSSIALWLKSTSVSDLFWVMALARADAPTQHIKNPPSSTSTHTRTRPPPPPLDRSLGNHRGGRKMDPSVCSSLANTTARRFFFLPWDKKICREVTISRFFFVSQVFGLLGLAVVVAGVRRRRGFAVGGRIEHAPSCQTARRNADDSRLVPQCRFLRHAETCARNDEDT